jgi:transcription elongation GreA/GreB family factor
MAGGRVELSRRLVVAAVRHAADHCESHERPAATEQPSIARRTGDRSERPGYSRARANRRRAASRRIRRPGCRD